MKWFRVDSAGWIHDQIAGIYKYEIRPLVSKKIWGKSRGTEWLFVIWQGPCNVKKPWI
jgi:hypothetical protein